MKHTARRLTLTAGLALAAAGMLAMSPAIVREGDSAHRAKVTELEAKAFPAALLGGLGEWVGGEAVTESGVNEGQVVAFAVIDSQNAAAMTMLNTMTRLARTHGDKGLKVFAVHGEENWDALAALAEQGRVRIPVAKDTGGAFTKGVLSDDVPDVYIIDRAGNLRYADFETRVLELAVTRLLRETVEQAAANAGLEAKSRNALMAERPTPAATPARTGETKATPEQYAAAAWPAHNTGSLSGKSVQGQPMPVPMGSETWLTTKQDLTGKVVVLDFWATWCGPCIQVMPTLDSMQQQHRTKLAIVGVAGMNDDISAVRNFVNRSKHSYHQVYDASQRMANALEIRGIPHAVVMSTDGVVRWQGHPGSPQFRQAVEQVLKVDPGLQ
jgi:cytochrome c biogenesis protein CcmG/thiol:disulfide interchange protein DsbE